MKIGFVAPSAYVLGGLATWLDQLLPRLSRAGWSPWFLPVAGPKFHRPERYLDVHPFPNVRVVNAPTATPIGRRRALREALTELKLDVAVSVNVPDLIATIGSLRGNGVATPHSVMAVHGLEHNLFADMRLLRPSLDGVICTNRAACALAAQVGQVSPGRILYASCGADVDELINEPPPRCEVFRVLYAGRLEQTQKRICDVARIVCLLAESRPVCLTIAGTGPAHDELLAALALAPIGLSVRDIGSVPADQMNSVYRSQDALLITSLWETGPLVAWEAMSQCLPVVSSRYVGSGLENALIDGDNALMFDVGDCDAATRALVLLAASPDLAERLVTAGLRLIEERYSIERSTSAWIAGLTRVASCARASEEARVPDCQFAVESRSPPRAHSRLDRVMGAELAESVRTMLGRLPPLVDAGSEWPSALSAEQSDEAFWRNAAALDGVRSA